MQHKLSTNKDGNINDSNYRLFFIVNKIRRLYIFIIQLVIRVLRFFLESYDSDKRYYYIHLYFIQSYRYIYKFQFLYIVNFTLINTSGRITEKHTCVDAQYSKTSSTSLRKRVRKQANGTYRATLNARGKRFSVFLDYNLQPLFLLQLIMYKVKGIP